MDTVQAIAFAAFTLGLVFVAHANWPTIIAKLLGGGKPAVKDADIDQATLVVTSFLATRSPEQRHHAIDRILGILVMIAAATPSSLDNHLVAFAQEIRARLRAKKGEPPEPTVQLPPLQKPQVAPELVPADPPQWMQPMPTPGVTSPVNTNADALSP